MKLVHPNLEGKLLTEDHPICEWVIESPELFTEYVGELVAQINGKDGCFVLSENDKESDISKIVEIIINPFDVDINSKKVLSKLYLELEGIALGEEYYMQTQELLGTIRKFLVGLEQVSLHMFETDIEIEPLTLFKALGIKFENFADNLLEQLVMYLKVVAGLLRKKVVVFVNIRSYINKEQTQQLIETALYEEVSLLFIENIQRDVPQNRALHIIDCDGCELY